MMHITLLFLLLQSAPTLVPALKTPVPAPVPTEERIAATPLSRDLPADIPAMTGGNISDWEFFLPPNTIANASTDSLSSTGPHNPIGMMRDRSQWHAFYLGLVRAGMEDVGLCKPSVPCPAVVRFRATYWEEVWEPDPSSTYGAKRQVAKGMTLIQATFTTRSTWNEIVYTEYENEQRGWIKTSTGWRSIGVLRHIMRAIAQGYPQDHAPVINEKARETFYRLLACTTNTKSFCQ